MAIVELESVKKLNDFIQVQIVVSLNLCAFFFFLRKPTDPTGGHTCGPHEQKFDGCGNRREIQI